MRYPASVLDPLRQRADPIPDQLIADLAAAGQTDEVNAILRKLLLNSQGIPPELPDPLENWLRETDKLPDGVDEARLHRAAAFFVEHGMLMTLIMVTASFVFTYAAYPGVKVLTATYRLGQNAYRRVAETAQFLLLVLAPGGLGEEGQAIPAIQKVRLMHAAIRHLMRQSGRWDEAAHGAPICQEDQLGTIMALSWLVIHYMRRLNVPVTEAEAEDYLYLWCVVGQMLGCVPDQLPRNMAEAEELTQVISRRHHQASPEGIAMTRALLDLHADLIPGTWFDGLLPAVTRYLVGEPLADMMEIPRSSWDHGIGNHAKLLEIAEKLGQKSNSLDNVVDHLGKAFLTRQAIALNGYERAAFAIPAELHAAWHMAPPEKAP